MQVAALCGQHCLNALLQGPYFTEIDLAQVANAFLHSRCCSLEVSYQGDILIPSFGLEDWCRDDVLGKLALGHGEM